jgi:hypothetical protein
MLNGCRVDSVIFNERKSKRPAKEQAAAPNNQPAPVEPQDAPPMLVLGALVDAGLGKLSWWSRTE